MNAPAQKSNTLKIVLIVVGALLFLAVAVVGVLFAVGLAGAKKYVSSAKTAEGRMSVTRLATGIASCTGEETAGATISLPESTPWVPAALNEVSGRKFMSAPTDWEHPSFKCAMFSISMPQYFRYRWERTSVTQGVARGEADLDGDGTAEVVLSSKVNCNSGKCEVGPLTEGP
ncbi:MAG: hypothetical protein R3B13_19740 [Polyangiaceae bacterium]